MSIKLNENRLEYQQRVRDKAKHNGFNLSFQLICVGRDVNVICKISNKHTGQCWKLCDNEDNVYSEIQDIVKENSITTTKGMFYKIKKS